MCISSQHSVFAEASEMVQDLLGVDLSAKQFQRVSEYYGQKMEALEEDYQAEIQDVPLVISSESKEPVYITMDGSMVFTREEGWKEMKVGRIYSESARVSVQEDRTEVVSSLYVCTFGTNKEFFKKFEPYVEPYRRKVFIADGAKWIWNWIEDFYGDSVQILDFYHALEKLGVYAALAYKDIDERRRWLNTQKQRLKADEVEKVLEELQETAAKTINTTDVGKALTDVIRYYQSNIERMKYGTFLKCGYLIGSGAIESAHRSVVQQRLKLSGQRWSIQGAQRIANLRAYRKSNRWESVIEIIKKAA